MSETGHGADPRTARSLRLPRATAPAPAAAVTPPTRRGAPMLWTIGFLVTFTFGGLTGVILASPPMDFHV
ncbi:hypothetical protein ACWCY1_16260, partial [Streptomyces goshikiensis]